MISAQAPLALVARENRYALFRIMLARCNTVTSIASQAQHS